MFAKNFSSSIFVLLFLSWLLLLLLVGVELWEKVAVPLL